MVDKMLAAGYETVWAKTDPTDSLVYLTINAETAKKARAALSDAGALCDVDLGMYGDVQVTEDADADGASDHKECRHGSYDLIARCARCGHEQALDINRKDRDSEIEAIKGSARRTVAARDDLLRRKEETIQRMDEKLASWSPLIAVAIEQSEALEKFYSCMEHGDVPEAHAHDQEHNAAKSRLAKLVAALPDGNRVGRLRSDPAPADRPYTQQLDDLKARLVDGRRIIADLEQKNEDLEAVLATVTRHRDWFRSQVEDVRNASRAVEQLAEHRLGACKRLTEENFRIGIRLRRLERLRDELHSENDDLHAQLVEQLRATLPEPDPLGMKYCSCTDATTNPEKDK
jgi:hypothetical protein